MLSRIVNLPKSNSFFLFGPRLTGKSTWIQASFPQDELLQFNLLKRDEYMRYLAEPRLLREEIQGRPARIRYVLIDEIQKIPELLDEVHFLMESERQPLHFILSGSSARKLKRSGANLLGGRAWTRHLYPLTHLELGAEFDLDKALAIGTLPKMYLQPNLADSNQYLKSYVETYLKEEIEAEALVRSSGTFLRFLFHSGMESGNTINYSAISRDTGTTHVTVKEYYKILEDTLLGNFLVPFSRSDRKRLAGHPKFYLFDTGVTRALTRQLSLAPEPGTNTYGNLFENWVINETIRICDYFEKDFNFSYFRTERGAEVDLVIETPRGKRVGIEIKSSSQPRLADFSAGFEAIRKIDPKIELKCVSRAPHPRTVGDEGRSYEILPWRDYFSYLIQL